MYFYQQNPGAFSPVYSKANTDAPLLYSTFAYNIGFWPKGLVELSGNLVSYKCKRTWSKTFDYVTKSLIVHEFGGHFPALDNPPALADDIRLIGKYW